jgi:hypothetical protein
VISYNSLLLYARKSEALMVSEREQVCWTLQKFFNNEKTRSAAAEEEGWTRTTKAAASHHIHKLSAHLQALGLKADSQHLQFLFIL